MTGETVLCPTCPRCGGEPAPGFGVLWPRQAFCEADECEVLLWCPDRSPEENMGAMERVDLGELPAVSGDSRARVARAAAAVTDEDREQWAAVLSDVTRLLRSFDTLVEGGDDQVLRVVWAAVQYREALREPATYGSTLLGAAKQLRLVATLLESVGSTQGTREEEVDHEG